VVASTTNLPVSALTSRGTGSKPIQEVSTLAGFAACGGGAGLPQAAINAIAQVSARREKRLLIVGLLVNGFMARSSSRMFSPL
jgi:hypothetical protein